MDSELILSLIIGIGLSASVGFRIFVPFLVLSIFSLLGFVNLSSGFDWIGTYPALIAFGFASLVEIVAYFFPWFDNLLDTIAGPASIIAGALVMGSVLADFNPLLKWSLAIIAGGGLAGTIQHSTGLLRLTSSTTTGGIANPVLSTTEAGASFSLSALAILLPVVAFILVMLLVIWVVRKFHKIFFKKKNLMQERSNYK
ncbi:MAG: DUF4126 domain-containing protein [Ignavibacteria bacterium]|nr:DUF4126 domain-containing protein [Ignavibacteria bacterium]